MSGTLKHCWACGKFGMRRAEWFGKWWYRCDFCGATDIIGSKHLERSKSATPKRSVITGFQMPAKGKKKGGKHR